MREIRLCKHCKSKPIFERYSSGGPRVMIKCPHPDCWHPDDYFVDNDQDKIIERWNERMSDDSEDH